MSEFKAVYKKDDEDDLISDVPFLSRLAEHYEATAALNRNDWVDLLKVCDIIKLTVSLIIKLRSRCCLPYRFSGSETSLVN